MPQKKPRHWSQARLENLQHTTRAAATLTALGTTPLVLGQIQFDWPETIPDTAEVWNFITGDFDRDGLLDFAFPVRRAGINIFRNDGNGGFYLATVVNPDTTLVAGNLQARDIDLDGDVDLIWSALDFDDNYFIEVALNDGTGLNWQLKAIRVSESTTHLVVGNLDRDSDLDIIVATGGTISVIENDEGEFLPARIVYDRTADDYSFRELLLGDFDRDGDQDLAILLVDGQSYNNHADDYYKVYGAEIVILANDRSGYFPTEKIVNLPYRDRIRMTPRRLRAADLDGDQDLDFALLVGNTDYEVPHEPAEYRIIENDLPNQRYLVGAAVKFGHGDAFAFEVADIDTNGHIDLLMATYEETAAYVIPNQGDLVFAEERAFPTDCHYPRNLKVGDFSDDGQIDLLLGGWWSGVQFLENITPLPDHPRLTATPFIRGAVGQITLTGFEPGEHVWIALTNRGWANTYGIPFFGFHTFDLKGPMLGSTKVTADDNGAAIINWPVPTDSPLGPVFLQGVARRGVNGDDSIKTPFVTSMISD